MRSAWVLLLSAVAVEVPTAADLDGATTNANGEEEVEIAPWDDEGFGDDDGDDEGAGDDEDSALEGMQVEALPGGRPFRVSLLESLQGRLNGRKLAAVENLDVTLQGKGPPRTTCSNGDVQLVTNGGDSPGLASGEPEYFFDGEWHPICGHFFWDNHHGATALCQKLGYTFGIVHATRTTYAKNAFKVGRCVDKQAIDSCTGGCNERDADSATECAECQAGQGVGIIVTCIGGSEIPLPAGPANSCPPPGGGRPGESECVSHDDCGGTTTIGGVPGRRVCKFNGRDRVYQQCDDRRRTGTNVCRRRERSDSSCFDKPREDRRRYGWRNYHYPGYGPRVPLGWGTLCCGCSAGECGDDGVPLWFQETTGSKTEDGGRLYSPFVLSTIGIVVIALSLVAALGCLLRPVQNDPVASKRVTRHLNFAEQGRGDARSPSQPVARN